METHSMLCTNNSTTVRLPQPNQPAWPALLTQPTTAIDPSYPAYFLLSLTRDPVTTVDDDDDDIFCFSHHHRPSSTSPSAILLLDLVFLLPCSSTPHAPYLS